MLLGAPVAGSQRSIVHIPVWVLGLIERKTQQIRCSEADNSHIHSLRKITVSFLKGPLLTLAELVVPGTWIRSFPYVANDAAK